MNKTVESKQPTDTRIFPHESIASVERSGMTKALDREDLPWLPREQPVAVVPLVTVTRRNGSQYYYGQAIKGDLKAIASQITQRTARTANKLLFAGIERLLDGDSRAVEKIDKPSSKWPTYYTGNGDGVRTYFLVLPLREGKPVVIRIAVGQSKGVERQIYGAISTDKVKEVNRRLFR